MTSRTCTNPKLCNTEALFGFFLESNKKISCNFRSLLQQELRLLTVSIFENIFGTDVIETCPLDDVGTKRPTSYNACLRYSKMARYDVFYGSKADLKRKFYVFPEKN